MSTIINAPAREDLITLKHGAGGRAMRRLIEDTLTSGLRSPIPDVIGLADMDDGAARTGRLMGRIALTQQEHEQQHPTQTQSAPGVAIHSKIPFSLMALRAGWETLSPMERACPSRSTGMALGQLRRKIARA